MRCSARDRMEEVVFTGLRFGHTGLNNTLYKIGKHSMGGCDYCGEEEHGACPSTM